MLTFYLPVESSERMELGVTVSLSYLVSAFALSQATPAKDDMPILGENKEFTNEVCPQSFDQGVIFFLSKILIFNHRRPALE